MNGRLGQIRTDALAAGYIYTKKLDRINGWSIVTNVLTILVPILFSGALLIAKGTSYEDAINVISIVLSAFLLAIVVFTLILKVDQEKESSLIARRSNFYVANEALKLQNSSESELIWFYNFVNEMDSRDKENLGSVSEALKQEAYRESLKKFIPGSKDTVCSVCHASPFIYKKGSCQLCGNTPATT